MTLLDFLVYATAGVYGIAAVFLFLALINLIRALRKLK